jgi:thiosulfate dehydrogenase [quinone] large subunit
MSTTSTSTASASSGSPAARSIAILPPRLFLGATFVDAGLGKLLSAAYLGPGPQGFAAQARGFAHASPIGWLVRAIALRHPDPVGLLLALAELAVGLLTLAGLASRTAAAGGLALSLLFFLTASWHTRPFFYGADLPFAMSWLVLLLAGPAGLPSVDRWLARRQRAAAGLRDDRLVAVPLDRVREVCAAADQHGRCPGAARACRGQRCPLIQRPAGPVALDARRRALLARGALAVLAVGATTVLGGGVAAAARILGTSEGGSGQLPPLPRTAPQPPARPARPTGRRRPAGTRIGALSDVGVGQAATFTAPDGRPAVVVRLGASRVVAYSAVCTHAGCTVGYDDAARLLACPCHGAEFDPRRGATVVAGPAPSPLPTIPIQVGADGGLYLPPRG